MKKSHDVKVKPFHRALTKKEADEMIKKSLEHKKKIEAEIESQKQEEGE